MAPTVIPAKAGIQFFRSPAWMPASAGMTNWVALVAAYGAHVYLAHISPNLASPGACPEQRQRGVEFQPSSKETSIPAGFFLCLLRGLLHATQLKHDFAVIGASKLRRVRVLLP